MREEPRIASMIIRPAPAPESQPKRLLGAPFADDVNFARPSVRPSPPSVGPKVIKAASAVRAASLLAFVSFGHPSRSSSDGNFKQVSLTAETRELFAVAKATRKFRVVLWVSRDHCSGDQTFTEFPA